MHIFARVWEGSGARGIEGDYEFLVLSTSNDTIRLRGKKWKNDMELIRMPEKTNWTSYLTSIYNLKEQLTLNSSPSNWAKTLDTSYAQSAASPSVVHRRQLHL